MEFLYAIATAIVSAAFAAGGAYAAVRVKLEQLEHGVKHAHDRLDQVGAVLFEHATKLPR